ncbi:MULTISPECIES: DUF3789 domain-containing protein [Enterococcus]|uniref:DUF3789 domain-containing protein n=1 Tax=Enterococcus TaxID=1350 RepID=UPI000F4D8DA1|nr:MULTISPECIES: DUF3789 domain-containing protein [Enterococcus]ROX91039.1 DUF3789 domain-containing protein [Enterococcus hirae]EGP5553318.1 DUF3789 domain-containing protein [Enterococcus faecium]EGP5585045.1 DUF3789 domain-containing protein [Enterococcus faecium]EGP5735365.1 hypothetical protein [Enterococcus faecium]MDG4619936.1 DUF3789 domain-containing protein [Enterococcus lactis]
MTELSVLIGLLLFFFGGFIGVSLMCIIQVGAALEKEIYEESKFPTIKDKE